MKAFPVHADVPQDDDYEGMDLRDYFAIECLQSFIGNEKNRTAMLQDAKNSLKTKEKEINDFNIAKEFSENAYLYADAMMEVRSE